ncbi:FAD-binding oxidoreductase [Mycolicibacterium sp. A43C]
MSEKDTAAEIIGELVDIVGRGHVLTDPETIAGYRTDWTGRFHGHTDVVVRPANTAEVAAVLGVCHAHGVPVVPQGGNTGLVGGSVPMHGELVLSTRRLDKIEHVDPVGRTLAAGAGVTVARAQQAARELGLDLGVDLASRDSATLGGIVGTNAGGVRVIKNGGTRAQLLGIEAVRSDGCVVTRWKELTKDNIGYDLPGLLAGSEGTLAVITRVLMRLVVPVPQTVVALVAVPSVDAALVLLDRVQRRGLRLEAAEFMTGAGVDLVCRHTGLRAPFGHDAPIYLLLEVPSAGDAENALSALFTDTVLDATLAAGPARTLWQYRERHTESISAESRTPAVKLDVSVPLRVLADFFTTLDSRLRAEHPDVRAICFGHIADGNVHVNVLDVPVEKQHAITDLVLRMVADHQGSISAEHGIGHAKAAWIKLGRSANDIDTMKRIRAAFDPAGILNPHVLPR